MAKKKESKSGIDLKLIFTILSQPNLKIDSALLKNIETAYTQGTMKEDQLLPSILGSGLKYGLQGNKGGKRVAEQFIKAVYAKEIGAFNKSIQDERDKIKAARAINRQIAAQNKEGTETNKANAENFRERKENYKNIQKLNKEIDRFNKDLEINAEKLKGTIKNEATAQMRAEIKKRNEEIREQKQKAMKELERQYEIQVINEVLDADYLKEMSVKYFTPSEMNKVANSNDQVGTIKKIFEKKSNTLFKKTVKLNEAEKENLRIENTGLELNAYLEVYDKDKFKQFDFASQVREFDRVQGVFDKNLRTKKKRKEYQKAVITNERSNAGSRQFRAYNFNHFKSILDTLVEQLDKAIDGDPEFSLEEETEKLEDFLRYNADFVSLGSNIEWLDTNYDDKINYLRELGFSDKELFDNKNDIKLNDFSKIDKFLGRRYSDLKFRSDYNPIKNEATKEFQVTKEKELKKKPFKSFQNETQVREVLNTKGLSKLQKLEALKVVDAKNKVLKNKELKEQAKNQYSNKAIKEKEQILNRAKENVANRLSEVDRNVSTSRKQKLEAIKPMAEKRIERISKVEVPKRTIYKPKKSIIGQLVEPATRATKTPGAGKALRIETRRILNNKYDKTKK